MADFIQEGASIDYTPGSDVAAGDVVVLNDLIGVAKLPIKSGHLGALAVEGVFAFPKPIGLTVGLGESMYWDTVEELAETWNSSGVHVFLGKAVQAAASNDATVQVRMSQ